MVSRIERRKLFFIKKVDRSANLHARALQLRNGGLCIQNKHVGRDGAVVGARVLCSGE